MPSAVQICNLALAALGHKAFIQDLSEQSSEAIYANLFYDQARRETLRAHPWNFAKKRTSLALLSSTSGKWLYQYALPSDCLKARYIETTSSSKIEFEVCLKDDGTSRVINTNEVYATLAYTADVELTALFDPTFVSALSLKIASYLAQSITGSSTKSQEMLTRYVNAMRLAQTVDASEGETDTTDAPDWLVARIGGGEITIDA